jgi:hypothetical protein
MVCLFSFNEKLVDYVLTGKHYGGNKHKAY